MSKHKPYKDIQEPKNQELYLSKLIKKHHDDELKKRWDSIIKSKHSSAQIYNKKQSYIKSSVKLAAAIGLTLLLMFIAFQLINNKQVEPSFYALQEFNQPISHPGLTKGKESDTNQRTTAIINFNAKDFKQASIDFRNISEPNTEDKFYQAMAYFYSKEYDQTIQLLSPISDSDSVLSQEAKWYLSMAYILNNSIANAEFSLSRIKPNDWNYQKAQELLKNLVED